MTEIIDAIEKDPYDIELDQAGYFVIKVDHSDKCIYVDHYNYDKKIIRTIRGHDARNLYWTILENKWISSLSHAAYIGKELMRAEYALKNNENYSQN
ncbi:DUF4346 domain-containing protein [Acidaminobacter sp. JC074]|uniref:DUF4346 domain-containing protein n=1 Tax=Acidaminobacter sp. JC074 TaxID=2530199 RepID=UPI001F0D878C|nr:DUF4346 domain-containing protein [Acidaminobacter sp. JC074]